MYVTSEVEMKNCTTTITVLMLVAALALSGCNLSVSKPEEIPTSAPTMPPTAIPTQPPPTNTSLPTETATLPPPTETLFIPTPVPPTATRTVAPTAIVPVAGDKFDGSFDNGFLVFRIGTKGNWVILKSVTLKKANCQEGGTITQVVDYPSPTNFPVENGRFSFYLDPVTISGQFITNKRASGSIKLVFKSQGKTCTVGPLTWQASAP